MKQWGLADVTLCLEVGVVVAFQSSTAGSTQRVTRQTAIDPAADPPLGPTVRCWSSELAKDPPPPTPP